MQPAGVFEAVHLGVQDRAAALDAAIVPAADDAAVDHQHRADRNPALGESQPGLFDRHFQKSIHRSTPLAGSYWPSGSEKWPNLRLFLQLDRTRPVAICRTGNYARPIYHSRGSRAHH